jgi:hypothetical protein
MFHILGYDPENTTPTLAHFLATVHPEDRLMVKQVVQKEMSGLEDLPSDYRIVLPDGTIKHLHAIAHPVTNGSREIVEVIVALSARCDVRKSVRRRTSGSNLSLAARLTHFACLTYRGTERDL